MERVASKAEARRAVAEARAEGKTVAFVPTMGALHEGHLSLVRAACERAAYVVVSVFVNPTQFGSDEDYGSYPRDIGTDLELLAAEGVDLVFTPSTSAMYEADASVTVDPGPLAARWEGEARPGHFAGVATVVTKLLSVVRPHLAYFGEKDYQQLQVVRRLARDLDLGVAIVAAPVVRDRDGLALSSRNALLSPGGRRTALAIPEALDAVADTLAWGERDAGALERVMRERLAGAEGLEPGYAVVVDPETLEPLAVVDRPARVIVAAVVDGVRLIDSCALVPPADAARGSGGS